MDRSLIIEVSHVDRKNGPVQLLLQDAEQLLHVAMFLVQKFDNHRSNSITSEWAYNSGIGDSDFVMDQLSDGYVIISRHVPPL